MGGVIRNKGAQSLIVFNVWSLLSSIQAFNLLLGVSEKEYSLERTLSERTEEMLLSWERGY